MDGRAGQRDRLAERAEEHFSLPPEPAADDVRLVAAGLIAKERHGIRPEDAADLLGDEVEDLLGTRLAGHREGDAVQGGPLDLLPLALGDVPEEDEELVLTARDAAPL